MGVSVQVSLYPLGAGDINAAVELFIGVLRENDLPVEVSSMSTVVWGEAEEVFGAIRRAYERIAASEAAVMVMTVSNACPIPGQVIGMSQAASPK